MQILPLLTANMCVLFVLSFVFYNLRSHKFGGVVYNTKKYKLIKKQFLFSHNIVYKNPQGIVFYAELEGGFYIILGQKAHIHLQIENMGSMHLFNANPSFIRAYYSQNNCAYYQIDKMHTTVPKKAKINVFVCGCQYKWVPSRGGLRIKYQNHNYDIIFGSNVKCQSKSINHLYLEFDDDQKIDYSSFGFYVAPKDEKRQFLNDNFGFIDTKTWHNKKEYLFYYSPQTSPQKTYFTEKLKEKTYTILTKIHYKNYVTIMPTSYCMLTKSDFIKIRLSDFGIGKVIDLKKKKQTIQVVDMDTNFCMHLVFSRKILKCFLGCVFGQLYLFIELENCAVVEFRPFCLDFDVSLFAKASVQYFLTSIKNKYKSPTNIKLLSLENILILLNNQSLCGAHFDIFAYISGLYLQNLPHNICFLVANLLLTNCITNNDTKLSKADKKLIINCLKDINKYDKELAYCFVYKLLHVIKDKDLRRFLQEVLAINKPFVYNSFEYFFTHVLGVKIKGGCVWVESPLIDYVLRLFINNKSIEIQAKQGQDSGVSIDGLQYIGRNYVNVNLSSFGHATIQCSPK
ncbi:MAG: hypothetical protein IJU58_03465 [Clostridia bacterium]|nr:hypothetical protein [Clostridia bacterium]